MNFGDIWVLSAAFLVQKVGPPREEDSYCGSLGSVSWGPAQAPREWGLLEGQGQWLAADLSMASGTRRLLSSGVGPLVGSGRSASGTPQPSGTKPPPLSPLLTSEWHLGVHPLVPLYTRGAPDWAFPPLVFRMGGPLTCQMLLTPERAALRSARKRQAAAHGNEHEDVSWRKATAPSPWRSPHVQGVARDPGDGCRRQPHESRHVTATEMR